jgi:molybdate/tungstate transport system substrate-binding protein
MQYRGNSNNLSLGVWNSLRKQYLTLSALVLIILVSTLVFFFYVVSPSQKRTLKVLCAASLLFPLGKVEEAFEKANPDVNVEIEGHGSIQVIRQVTELDKEADLLMVADYSLIPLMMYNSSELGSNQSFADWYIRFASNKIVLAYTNSSKYANEVNATNWLSVLMKPNVVFGFPNPMIDALGYRALMVIQLAETYYGNNSIFHNLVTKNFSPPISSIPSNGNYTIVVPDVLQPKANVILRAGSIQLIPLLETGSMDYCFLYLSNAKQYGLRYVELPDEFNLGNPQFEELYEHVIVKFELQRFATIGLDRLGKTIYYGLTIPSNADQKNLAIEFAEFLLDEEGRGIFESTSHPVFLPSYTDNMQNVPSSLQSFVVQEP